MTNNESQKYKECWIRCVAALRSEPSGLWECAVYVLVSEPRSDWEPSDDTCFRTVIRHFDSERSALVAGATHAQKVIDHLGDAGRGDIKDPVTPSGVLATQSTPGSQAAAAHSAAP